MREYPELTCAREDMQAQSEEFGTEKSEASTQTGEVKFPEVEVVAGDGNLFWTAGVNAGKC